VGPTYSMVDFKKKLLDLYKSCTEVINVLYLNTYNVVIVLLEFWLIAEKTKKRERTRELVDESYVTCISYL
jgi:hypothetical protein